MIAASMHQRVTVRASACARSAHGRQSKFSKHEDPAQREIYEVGGEGDDHSRPRSADALEKGRGGDEHQDGGHAGRQCPDDLSAMERDVVALSGKPQDGTAP